MALYISSLNSGSNGNCYYVGNENEAILIDGGISRRETEKRLKRLELSVRKVKAVFVSHEHGDHIHGVPGFCNKHSLPAYFSANTIQNVTLKINEDLVRTFSTGEEVQIGGLKIIAFRKRHDAVDPHSFIVRYNDVTVGIFTDIGHCCDEVIGHFQQCNAVFLESNYDEQMLEFGKYPIPLKNRIRGGYGHLSNRQALKLFRDHKPAFMSHIFLSHLSHENNNPAIVAEMFHRYAGKTEVVIATRYEETALYRIDNVFSDLRNSPLSKARMLKSQLSLFG
jgi:phosphoribosyl 1,2-cyclic phosphodiesterase